MVLIVAAACSASEIDIAALDERVLATAALSGTSVAIAPSSSARPTRLAIPLVRISTEDPFALESFRASLVQPALTLERDSGTSLTASAVLDTLRLEARSPSSSTTLMSQKLLAGQRAASSLDTTQAACFTVAAHGGIGVSEVDAFIVSGADDDPTVLGTDTKTGPVAVVGGEAGCQRASTAACGAVCVDGDPDARVRVEIVLRKGKGSVVVGLSRHARQAP